jgi:hypothetical protein
VSHDNKEIGQANVAPVRFRSLKELLGVISKLRFTAKNPATAGPR